jgi:hypothetical protein
MSNLLWRIVTLVLLLDEELLVGKGGSDVSVLSSTSRKTSNNLE